MNPTIKMMTQFARSLQSPSFLLVWIGQTVSLLGDGSFTIALAWQVLILTGSGTAMGLVLMAWNIPRLLFILVGGVAADRVSRRWLMLWSDGGRAVIVAVIALLSLMHLLQLWHLIILVLCFGTVDSFFLPAFQALPPQLLSEENLPSANALVGLSQQTSILLGPLIGSLVIAFLGVANAFIFDGVTFLISVACLLAVREVATQASFLGDTAISKALKSEDASSLSKSKGNTSLRQMLTDIRDGFQYVATSNWILMPLILFAVVNIGYLGPLEVALPKFVLTMHGDGVWLLGMITAANAVGAIAATIIIGQFRYLPRRGIVMYCAVIGSSLALAVFGIPIPQAIAPFIISGANVLVGAGIGAIGVIWATTMQELVPANKLGRVSSIDWLCSLSLMPVGLVVTGLLTDKIGPGQVFVIGAILNIFLAVIALVFSNTSKLEK